MWFFFADKQVFSYTYEFIFRDATETWKNARDDCRGLNAELVKVHSAEITTIITEKSVVSYY